MSMKRTDLVKLQAIKVREAMKKAPVPGRFASEAAPDRREQRRLDQAAGLVPFACKLKADLVQTLRDMAVAEGGNLNAVTERLIRAGLDASSSEITAKPAAKKSASKEVVTQKAVAKKAVVKKPAAEKPAVAAKTAASQKVAAKKVAATKTAAPKAAPKAEPKAAAKPVTKTAAKPAAKKAAATKTVTKKKAKQT